MPNGRNHISYIEIKCELKIDDETYNQAIKYKAPWGAFERKVNIFKKKGGICPIVDFDYKDVMAKFGDNPTCYLSGAKLDYYTDYCVFEVSWL